MLRTITVDNTISLKGDGLKIERLQRKHYLMFFNDLNSSYEALFKKAKIIPYIYL